MAVPKRRTSRSRTRHRRAQWRAAPVSLARVKVRGETVVVPGRLARAVQRGLIDLDDVR